MQLPPEIGKWYPYGDPKLPAGFLCLHSPTNAERGSPASVKRSEGKPEGSLGQPSRLSLLVYFPLNAMKIFLSFLASALVGCAQGVQQPPVEENATPQVSLQGYTAQVVQVGGEGSHTVTKSAWNALDSDTAEQLVSVDFSAAGDVLWAQCVEGYVVSNCQSSTSNLVAGSDGFCSISVTEQFKNVVTFDCTLEQENAVESPPESVPNNAVLMGI